MFGLGFWELLIILSLGFGSATSVPPKPEDPRLRRVVPEAPLAYLRSAGVGEARAGSRHPTERLIGHPQVQHVVKAVTRAAQTTAAAEGAPPAQIDLAFTLIDIVRTEPFVLYLSELIPPQGKEPPKASGAVVLRVGEDRAGLLESLLGMTGVAQGEPRTVEGVAFHPLPTPPEAPMELGFVDGYLVLALGAGSAEQVVAALGTKGEAPQWLKGVERALPIPRRGMVAHLDLERLRALLGTSAPPDVMENLRKVGLDTIDAVQYSGGLDADGVVARTRVVLRAGTRPQVLDRARPLAPGDLAHLPADPDLATAARVDLAAVLDLAIQMDPALSRRLDRGTEEMGADPRKLLAALGTVWTVSASPSTGGPLLLDATATVDLRKPAAVRRMVASMEKKLVERWRRRALWEGEPGKSRLRRGYTLGTMEAAGCTVHFVRTVGREEPVAPAWCVNDTHLVVAAFPQAVRAHQLRQKTKRRSRLAEVLAGNRKSFSVSFVHSRRLVERFYPFSLPIASVALAEAQSDGFDLSIGDLPDPAVLTEPLDAVRSRVWLERDGLHFETRSVLPGGGALLLAVPAAAAMMAEMM